VDEFLQLQAKAAWACRFCLDLIIGLRHAVIEMMELISCIATGHWELVKTDFSTAINFEKNL
jgi:hypothetical protein